MRRKILLAEDDPGLGMVTKDYLDKKGYECQWVKNGTEALEALDNFQPDVMVLDVMMPEMDGFEVAARVSQSHAHIPFLFLTARNIQEDVIEGLKIGAEDYITKPFSMEELLLRLEVVFRHQSDLQKEKVTELPLALDHDKQHLLINEHELPLTPKEFELMSILVTPPYFLDKRKALIRIWGNDDYFASRSMDVFISKIRKYLSYEKSLQLKTVHGKGYQLIISK